MGAADRSTPLMAASGQGAPAVITEDTLLGSEKGDPLDAIKLFLAAGADVNAANDQGFTAIHFAAQTGRTRIVEFLSANGARLDVKNKAGRTPLDLATAPAMKALIGKLTVQ
jgi:ankyrin repeat protein